MNTSKLELNKEYKNYKVLCIILEEKIKNGKSKKLQLQDWSRYFKYHKIGNKFIIDEIYDTPKEKIDNRKGHSGKNKNSRNNCIYGGSVDIILSYYFKNTSNAIIYKTTNQLAVQAGLINRNYSSAFSNKHNFFKYSTKDTELNSTAGFDFFSFCKGSLKDIIRKSLQRLYSLKYIIFEETYLLSYQYEVRRATEEEIQIIENIEQQVLKDMQIDNKNKLQYNDKLRKRYYDKINNLAMDKIDNLDVLYIGYKITINKDNIPDEKHDIQQLREELNKLFKERTLMKMQKRKDKYVEGNPYIGQPSPFWEEFVLERLNENYMQYANYICNMLLDLKTKDIRDYLKL
ncbi:hypothetical protein [Clostridium ljungdahlii]|uniref:hypothetical protein n=1 Tax=Clostridium ljungdahlii TaxID=1538 RepID=UPI00386D3A42